MNRRLFLIFFAVVGLAISAPLLSSDCNQAIDSFFQSEVEANQVLEVRTKLQKHVEELQEELFDDEDILDELLEEGLAVDTPSSILECPLCTASSISLKYMLEKDGMFGRRKVRLQLTDGSVGDTKFRHFYLMIKNYLKSENDLIIDPTIRQFFVFRQDREVIDSQVPKVFVGTKKQLRVLFEQFGPPDSKVDPEVWVKSYLDSKEQIPSK